ncbi:MAG: NADPH-dependent assimilatory sulfite reductase hemoprotein subunit [Actinomycetota bacterium]
MSERSPIEDIKERSAFLAGSIGIELTDGTERFEADTTQVLKFHGIYQQDDRDARKQRRARGLDRDWIMMVRAAVPGGRLTADQWLVMDRLADEVGDGTLRITSRQGVQWHHTRKRDLRHLISTLNRSLVTTLGACGDVVRNTMACPAPLPGRAAVRPYVDALAAHFRPRTRAYYHIWVDGERAVTAQAGDPEPVYGPTYLPRKFKIAFSHPGDNCTDVYSHDVGIVPHLDGDEVAGFTVLVGGGMGRSHNQPDTFPRISDPLAYVAAHELVEVVEAIVATQRDYGERFDRKHARLKYLVAYWGLEDFKLAVERRLGRALAPPRPLEWASADDHLGWHTQPDGRWFLGVPVENGRVSDDGARLRSGLREVIEQVRPGIYLTPSQNLLLAGVADHERARVDRILAAHGIPVAGEVPVTIRSSMACVALPTCGLALTDAERALPRVIRELTATLGALGLGDESVQVRMTGCPNGCARPYNSEVGLVGRRSGHYDIHLGADTLNRRLNFPAAETVPESEIVATLAPLLTAWRDRRLAGESFGDFCHRMGAYAISRLLERRASA